MQVDVGCLYSPLGINRSSTNLENLQITIYPHLNSYLVHLLQGKGKPQHDALKAYLLQALHI